MARSQSAFIKTSGNPLGHRILNLAGLQYGIISIPRYGISDIVADVERIKEKLATCVERQWLTADEAQATIEDAAKQGLAADKMALIKNVVAAAGRVDVQDMGSLSFKTVEGCRCKYKHGAVVQTVKGREVERLSASSLESALDDLESRLGPDSLNAPQALKLFADMAAAGLEVTDDDLEKKDGETEGEIDGLLASLFGGRGISVQVIELRRRG